LSKKYKRTWEVKNGVQGITCTTCSEWKPKAEYHKNDKSALGIKTKCRGCCSKEKRAWSRSVKGVVYTIYSSQKDSCITRGMESPQYTRDWLYEWCVGQELFHTLYDGWVQSNYNKYVKPSVDRIDNLKTYTEDNIRLMTWGENLELAHKSLREGDTKYNHTAVYQQDLEGNIINEFFGITEAQRQTNIYYENIQKVCKRERFTTGGFFWSFVKGFNLEESKQYLNKRHITEFPENISKKCKSFRYRKRRNGVRYDIGFDTLEDAIDFKKLVDVELKELVKQNLRNN